MVFHPDLHRRRSMRLRDYDYVGAGAYFVTVCAWRRECLFGDGVDGGVLLNDVGVVVRDEWLRTAVIRPNIKLDEFVVMPNHFHAIFWITDPVGATRWVAHDRDAWSQTRATQRVAPTAGPRSGSVGAIIGQFKSAATKRINTLRHDIDNPVWQRNYHEHVIRGDRDLQAVRQYIVDNPAKWELDVNHPDRV
ncbi:transposase [Geoalkalibacter subterraneus]|uniref:Transposase n=1 Tax=Geoalkalibacter subterraneus TaxID=483547 RepID=A0A0B5FEH9_9BACT|nr:transposase [Geoalkalibacter subterraneus]AJF06517.1 transposase [Geoalkalibacter subterraneus]